MLEHVKTCYKCKKEKPATLFYKNKARKDGLHSECIECFKLDNNIRKRKSRQNLEYKAREAKAKKLYREKNSEQHKLYMKKWHTINKNAQKIYTANYRAINKEYFKNYTQTHKHKILANTRFRQLALRHRTPKWLSSIDIFEIQCIYRYCGALRSIGLQYEVDHIVPLQGHTVSGLHTPENLQILPRSLNRSKANHYGEV